MRQKVDSVADEVVVSYGKVEDIGQRAGTVLMAAADLRELAARDPHSLSPGEKRRLLVLQRQHAELLGMLPEIAAFQDRPAEYGKFFRNLVGQAASLTQPQGSKVETYMSSRAAIMTQQGLNFSSQPNGVLAQQWWELKRDHFNEQTAAGLTALLPPDAARKAGIGPELMEFLEMDFDKTAAATSP